MKRELDPSLAPAASLPILSLTRRVARVRRGVRVAAWALMGVWSFTGAFAQPALNPPPRPSEMPVEWEPLVGDYGPMAEAKPLLVLEREGQLWVAHPEGETQALARVSPTVYATGHAVTPEVTLSLAPTGVATLRIAALAVLRRDYLAASGSFTVHPARPVAQLRAEALSATMPVEAGVFRQPELVELATLDPLLHLDIRYASTNNFLGTPVYSQARAFLQRPAAEALVRVLGKLQPLGYGLLIHDAYRPWYVTKIFWEATPPEGKIFVADPAQGSRHNRGCAVDLTLYELATGKPVPMPGTYDEMSPRSFPTYPGGTSLQRWHRELLRVAMTSEGYTVYETEWWHFDYQDWKAYPILNLPFEALNVAQGFGKP